MTLPSYAYEYQDLRGNAGAQFYDDSGGTICVYLEPLDCGLFALNTDRGGLSENAFTARELGCVLQLAGILAQSRGIVPPVLTA